MSKPFTTQKSLEFSKQNSVLKHESKRTKHRARNLGIVALSAATLVAGYNTLEKVGKIKPTNIETVLSTADSHKLATDGLPAIEDITVTASNTPINFRSSCAFETSDGQPLDNIVYTLNPSASGQPKNTLNFNAAIPVNGPSADPNISSSDTWFVIPTGEGNQALCFDASQASRGNDFSNVTVANGENAVLSNPNAIVKLENNTIFVNGQPLPHQQLVSQNS